MPTTTVPITTVPDYISVLVDHHGHAVEHTYRRAHNAMALVPILRQLRYDPAELVDAFVSSRTFRRRLASALGTDRVSPACLATALAFLETPMTRSPYALTIHPDALHHTDRQGPTIHGYPVLRLDHDWIGGHTVWTRDGSDYVVSVGVDAVSVIDTMPEFVRGLVGQLPADVFGQWRSGDAGVAIYKDGCYTVCPVWFVG